MANYSLRADNSFKKFLSVKVSVKRVPTVVCIWFMLLFIITRVRLIKIARFSSVLHELPIVLATLFFEMLTTILVYNALNSMNNLNLFLFVYYLYMCRVLLIFFFT